MDWRVITIIAAVVVWIVFQTWITAYQKRSRQFKWMKRLHCKGYDWLTYRDTGRLLFELHGYLHDIPLEEDIAGRDDYSRGDVEALIGILKNNGHYSREENERYEQWGGIAAVYFIAICSGFVVLIAVIGMTQSRIAVLYTFLAEISLVFIVQFWVGNRARSLRDSLHNKGYHWINTSDSLFILLKLGKNARRIPTRDEMATVPGYVDGNAARLVMAVKKHMPENSG